MTTPRSLPHAVAREYAAATSVALLEAILLDLKKGEAAGRWLGILSINLEHNLDGVEHLERAIVLFE